MKFGSTKKNITVRYSDYASIWHPGHRGFRLLKDLLGMNKDKSLKTPSVIQKRCPGIELKGQLIRSVLFSTDLAIIENNDSDAVLAVYPFPPSANIMKALIDFSGKPVICGIGGGITKGTESLKMAKEAEQLGACAVIVNQPFKNADIEKIRAAISLPIISTVTNTQMNFEKRIKAGVTCFHVTAAERTPEIIQMLKAGYPDIPCIATGGKSVGHLNAVLDGGTDAVVLTPPSNGDLFKSIMSNYRKGVMRAKKRLFR